VRVLLIEDDPDDYYLARDLLNDIPGNPVHLDWASSADAGRDALANCEHDAYVVDYRLGAADGLELLKEALDAGCRAPIILLTGLGDRELAMRALEAGAADYLVKGEIDGFSLERAIRYALQQKRHADELEQKVAARTAELERLNSALRVSEEQYRLLVEGATGFGMMMLDRGGRITAWNVGAERLLGYLEREILGEHFSKLFIAEDRAAGKPVRELERSETSGRADDDNWLVRKDGSRFWASGVTSALRDSVGQLLGHAKVVRDITDRRRAEEALRSSEEYFRGLAQGLPIAIWICLPGGEMDFVNQQWLDYTGQDLEIARSSPTAWMKALDAQDLESVTKAYDDGILSRQGFTIEARFCRACDQTSRWHLTRCVPLLDEAGNVVKYLCTCTDIEDLKRAEEVLKEADRQKDEFLAMLAHELRNPLAPIRNALHFLRLGGGTPETYQQAHELMERQVEHLVRLVDDLLDVSRITRGKINLHLEEVDLSSVVARAVESSRPVIAEHGHQLEVSLPGDPISIKADPVRIAQVFLNLLNNAAKYTPRGGKIWLSAAVERGRAVVRVKDTGLGISAEMLPKIFDLFIQVDSALDRTQGGLGIGLTLVRRLTELHDGTVEALSEGPGHGSEFVVRLPVIGKQPKEAQPPTLSQMNTGRRRRLLVVDDNRDSAKSLALLLRLLGNDVTTAFDGQEALKQIASERPDAVFLDIGLPGLSGYDVARTVRGGAEFGKPVLIAMTGFGTDEDRQQSRAAGFDAHLVKPVELASLQKLLNDGELLGERA